MFTKEKLHRSGILLILAFMFRFSPACAGPIVRASEFIPQLYKEFHLTKREFSHSLFLISKGLIKKIIIQILLPLALSTESLILLRSIQVLKI